MLIALILGIATLFISMAIEVVVVVMMLRYLLNLMHDRNRGPALPGFGFEIYVIGVVLLVLFAGHLAQIAIWAGLFMSLGEFEDFLTAFYHSTVNFSSLGYGDIVMSEDWRLLGAIEASNGVLMFGLSTGALIATMTNLFRRRLPSHALLKDNRKE